MRFNPRVATINTRLESLVSLLLRSPQPVFAYTKKLTRVAAPLPRAKPRTAHGMRARGAASAAGLRSAMILRLYGYTGRCKFRVNLSIQYCMMMITAERNLPTPLWHGHSPQRHGLRVNPLRVNPGWPPWG